MDRSTWRTSTEIMWVPNTKNYCGNNGFRNVKFNNVNLGENFDCQVCWNPFLELN